MGDDLLPPIVRQGFSIVVERQSLICLKLTGNADMEMLPLLGPFLSRFHADVLHRAARSVVVDLRELYFMNSSCFKAIITWIAEISNLEAVDLYNVQFLANPSLHWQRRNLEAMRAFAPTIVTVVAA